MKKSAVSRASSLVVGMALAAFATGATRGFIYLRYEYPETQAILARAIAEGYDEICSYESDYTVLQNEFIELYRSLRGGEDTEPTLL